MHISILLPILLAFFNIFALADLHGAAVCVNWVKGTAVIHTEATIKACGNYKMRNKGSQHWNTCPDCKHENLGGLITCLSADWHMGGDEIEYYCKLNGAQGVFTN